MVVSIIGGTGPQGLGIAMRFIIEGIDVIVGSRNEDKALESVTQLEDKLKDYDIADIKGMANEDAAKSADILVLTVPFQAQTATLNSIKDYIEGKILIDATVPLETAVGGKPFRFLNLMEGSAAERTNMLLADKNVKVVSAFNNISNSHLSNIPDEIDCDCLIAGDDLESKKVAMDLINKLPGVRCIDCGKLEKARIIEKITPLLIGLNIKYKSHYGGIRITAIDPDK